MEAQVFTLDSGVELIVQPAKFAEADALRLAVMKSLRGLQMSGDMFNAELSMAEAFRSPALVSEVMDKLLAVATSAEVQAALFACGKWTTWNKIRVTPELFDDQEKGMKAREDFYPIMARILEVNVKPFFVKALSGLSGLLPKAAEVPASQK